MRGSARVGDLAVGVDYHPVPPSVFPWVGTPVQGDPLSTLTGLPNTRVGDLFLTTCPICGIGWAFTGNVQAVYSGPPDHRKSDVVQTPGGYGVTVVGAGSVMG